MYKFYRFITIVIKLKSEPQNDDQFADGIFETILLNGDCYVSLFKFQDKICNMASIASSSVLATNRP